MTPAQAIAIRAAWLTLGENGNLLASSWGRLLTDVEPLELIKLAERLSIKLPKLYADTRELIVATGSILEAEGDTLIDLPYGAGANQATPDDIILDELLGWEAGEPSRSSSSPAGGVPPTPSAMPPSPSPHTAGLDGETTTGPTQPQNGAQEPQNGAQEPQNGGSGPTTPETKVNGVWGPLARLLTEHSPELIEAMTIEATRELIEELEVLMVTARLWEANTLTELSIKWLRVTDWVAVPSYDLRAFAQRVVIQATAEVEGTGLGARALAEIRKETNHDL